MNTIVNKISLNFNFQLLILLFVYFIVCTKPVSSYSRQCVAICRDGCPSDVSTFANALCPMTLHSCGCHAEPQKIDDDDNYDKKKSPKGKIGDADIDRRDLNWESNSANQQKPNRGHNLTVLLCIGGILLVAVAVAIVVLVYNHVFGTSADEFEGGRLPNLHLNMLLQQPTGLGTERKMGSMPEGNGYVEQMHLIPDAPAQYRGPTPGFLKTNVPPPTYQPL